MRQFNKGECFIRPRTGSHPPNARCGVWPHNHSLDICFAVERSYSFFCSFPALGLVTTGGGVGGGFPSAVFEGEGLAVRFSFRSLTRIAAGSGQPVDRNAGL